MMVIPKLVPPEIGQAPVEQDLEELAIQLSDKQGLYLEFGVANGASLRRLRKLIPDEITLYGFDSFQGLPEAWGIFPKGSFATPYRVSLPNTELIVGLFEDTLPGFIRNHSEHVSFVHVDCDLYSSTRTVLECLKPCFVPGTILLFDELFGFSGFEQHEYRALQESGLQYTVIARWTIYAAIVRVDRKP